MNAGPNHCFTVSDRLVHNCGFGGSEGALIAMGALDMGIPLEELAPMALAWRRASPEIAGWEDENGYRKRGLWNDVEDAAKLAMRNKGQRFKVVLLCGFDTGISFLVSNAMLRMRLPSGRELRYVKPHFGKGRFGNTVIKYWGLHQKTKQWCVLDTFGAKLVENAVQAFARDGLCETLLQLDSMNVGYDPVMLVHDEDVMEVPLGIGSLSEVLGVMKAPIDFAPGLPLKGAGYDDAAFYYKD